MGVVIGCGEYSRLVEYTILLNEDESSELVKLIPVSTVVQGTSRLVVKFHRSAIRFLPPCSQVSEVKDGLCVDAWPIMPGWEGLITRPAASYNSSVE